MLCSSITWGEVFWRGDVLENWQSQWDLKGKVHWGSNNIAVISAPNLPNGLSMRVFFPAGSWNPADTKRAGLAQGGTQFFAPAQPLRAESAYLRYYVKFADNFDFVKGGKLPGLYGGAGNTGGKVPNGEDGFSTRYMWLGGGRGEVYAYLPTSKIWGTPLLKGDWGFRPGRWYCLEQYLQLNTPGKNDGVVSVWLDNRLLGVENGLLFRTNQQLKIDGLLFSTFFGGAEPDWATPVDTYIEFAEFQISDRRNYCF